MKMCIKSHSRNFSSLFFESTGAGAAICHFFHIVAYVDIDHELPIVISNLKTDQPTYQNTSKFEQLIHDLKTKNYVFLQPVWWIGIGSLIIGEFFQIFAFKYATTTLIAPLGAMRVISTAMFSRWYSVFKNLCPTT